MLTNSALELLYNLCEHSKSKRNLTSQAKTMSFRSQFKEKHPKFSIQQKEIEHQVLILLYGLESFLQQVSTSTTSSSLVRLNSE